MATVLVVDDDAPSREFMRTLLNHRGHQVEQAFDGDSALVLAARRPPDVVITDVMMPGLGGFELAHALRGEPETRHIPIVFSTAHYGPDEIRPLAHACDVHSVIFKPAQPATVLATIDSLLRPGRISLRADDQLAETQRLTRSGTWELDLDTRTVVVSGALRDVLGLPSTTLTSYELMRRVHPEDVARIAAMAGRTSWTAEVRVAGTGGTVQELIVSCRQASATRLWGAAQDVTRIREDLRTALRVQADWNAARRAIDAVHRDVLPPALPAIAGLGLATVYLPVPERLHIGTAWYDAQEVDGGRLLLSVGKVAGHDRHPVAVMGHALAVLHAYAHDDPDPATVLARLNRFLIDTRADDTFVTAVVALFEPATGRLLVANGGHPAPVVVSRDIEGHPSAVSLTKAGPALGVLAEAAFPQLGLTLAAGSAFCAYTDGLTDRHNDPAARHGRRLRAVAAQVLGRLEKDRPAAQFLADNIVRDMLDGVAPDDDVCVAVLHAGAELA
ncbi:SpoIIE family protein phosphatase [Actinoplanes sp. TBRC 11911]|uniref:SpoIIE family protein phosphatase n=1 Tax=Actinoplanes sp. TBRC 11911 TaxID=2729386 RepID=UPI00145D83D9|nr:SpoIIE family protein phosphatase [Actinoplanes sp. TBRC 11911]NMO49872.1 SpoIIE family protein phosphatase [Actinoplanes sp. TBRC 11911]